MMFMGRACNVSCENGTKVLLVYEGLSFFAYFPPRRATTPCMRHCNQSTQENTIKLQTLAMVRDDPLFSSGSIIPP